MAIPGNESLPAAGTYEIDPTASTVSFSMRTVFGLLPVHGTVTIEQGRITVAEVAEESSVDVSIDAASFDSGIKKRDDHVKSADYLDVARHPEMAFRSRRLERSGDAHATLYGELTACGVTQPVAVTLGAVAHDEKRLTARGTATIDRYAFGVTKTKGMTGRRLKVTLEVVANL
ncbi:YceI family protein [Streptomyces sp. NPDC000410]|uniref:YceI family protein n=1 Tax=Streptomyces sp. NPDC000410 TaxID=3154254 RepID=UPI00332E0157